MGMHIVVVGNPFDGLSVFGPFATFEEARAWADANGRNDDWRVVLLHSPDEES